MAGEPTAAKGREKCEIQEISPHSAWEVFLVSLRLGLTSFGGPIAHLGYFHQEFVVRRKWLGANEYADLVALCQFLPGPASSQVNLAVGLLRARGKGAFAAWLGFTLPSALLMIAFAYGIGELGDLQHAGWIKGLKLAAVAVVAQAVWSMAAKFCSERSTATIAMLGALVLLVSPLSWVQLLVIAFGTLAGWVLYRRETGEAMEEQAPLSIPFGSRVGWALLAAFGVLFIGLPFLKEATGSSAVASFDGFYRSGSLAFGGGHVVLPLLRSEIVLPGWVSDDRFLAGYGMAQALPGPLFTFSAYLGTVMTPEPHGWVGGLWALLAIFLPSVFLLFGALPFWNFLRRRTPARAALKGANAAVVGVLLAAFYHPIWTSSVQDCKSFIIALAAFGLLVLGSFPPWRVVAFSALSGWIFLG